MVSGVMESVLSHGTPPHVSREDLHSEGILGLIDAAIKFNPSKGVPFRAYAVLRIRGAILDEVRKIPGRTRSGVRLAEFINLESQRESLVDPCAMPWVNIVADERRHILHDKIKELPKRERHILTLHYFNDLPVREIARRFKVTTRMILRILRKTEARLHRLLSRGDDRLWSA
jgi:RNA polymerase sigma factor (sigma-70 family)